MNDEKLKKQLGANIVTFRKRIGLTQAKLAERLNYSDKAVSKWERGESMPDVLTLVQLAELFDTTVDELLRDRCAAQQHPRLIPGCTQGHQQMDAARGVKIQQPGHIAQMPQQEQPAPGDEVKAQHYISRKAEEQTGQHPAQIGRAHFQKQTRQGKQCSHGCGHTLEDQREGRILPVFHMPEAGGHNAAPDHQQQENRHHRQRQQGL